MEADEALEDLLDEPLDRPRGHLLVRAGLDVVGEALGVGVGDEAEVLAAAGLVRVLLLDEVVLDDDVAAREPERGTGESVEDVELDG